MGTSDLQAKIEELVGRWNCSVVERDLAAAAELREDGYTSTLPDGRVITREEELAMLSSPHYAVESASARSVEVRGRGEEATAVFENLMAGEYMGKRFEGLYRYAITFRKTGGRWRALHSRLEGVTPGWSPPADAAAGDDARGRGEGRRAGLTLGAVIPGALKSWLKATVRNAAHEGAPKSQETTYVPYKPGLDFVIPRGADSAIEFAGPELPIPPPELWLGYNYPAHGRAHVERMLEIVRASDFSFVEGDGVLDFGCGAGRMIRHLRDLSETCEVWGTDISAEHVYWCKQNLSPPFNFATTTKVPHLPFADGYFRLVYCGSVFTHIADLADAWLLELRRILAPGGRLYLTIHDEHTIELLESGRHDGAEVVRWIKSREVYQQSKGSFGMLVVGRGQDAQVFYHTDYFSKTVSAMFDIVSVTREAYFYQTAYLLRRKPKRGA